MILVRWCGARVAVIVAVGLLGAAPRGAAPLAAQQAPDSTGRAADTSRSRDVAGAARVVLDSAALAGAPMRTFSEALAGRAPGLSVLRSSGTVGAGSRVRLRSATGNVVPDEPLLIVDGVRADGSQASLGVSVGGQQPSRLDDIVPEDIERVEVLKGPAAAWRYGTGAANGAIVVTTKRGRPGRRHWQLRVAEGVAADPAAYPVNYHTPGVRPSGRLTDCPRDAAASGWCVPQGPMEPWDALAGPSPFRTGRQREAGASVAGGRPVLTYYASGGLRGESGVLDRNDARRATARANVSVRPRDDLHLTLTGGYLDGRTRLPQGDGAGPVAGALLGTSAGEFVYGGFDPELRTDIVPVRQDVGRLTAALAAEWRARSWLAAMATVGADRVNRADRRHIPISNPPEFGFRDQASDERSRRVTVTVEGMASYVVGRFLSASTAVGVDVGRTRIRRTERDSTVIDGYGMIAWGKSRVLAEAATTGLLVRQSVAAGPLAVSGGVRTDANQILGRDLDRAVFPAADASLTVVGERSPWRVPGVRLLRLRAAYAEAGDVRPLLALAQGFEPVLGPLPPPAPRRVVQRTSEAEAGLDLRLLGDRVGAELTYFRRTTPDGWLSSSSFATDYVFIASPGHAWRNRGVEALVSARLLDRPRARWEVSAGLATNRSDVRRLAGDAWGVSDDGVSVRWRQGYPLAGFWAFPYRSADADGDGLVAPTEVALASESFEYVAPSAPTRETSLATSARLFDRVTVAARLDHHGGSRRYNGTESARCSYGTCRGAHDAAAPWGEQARAVALRGWAGFSTAAGFLEDGTFTRLRELSVEADLPARWARPLGAQGARLTVAARNLATWTSYTGLDPETSATGQTGPGAVERFTQPLLRSVTARLDLSW